MKKFKMSNFHIHQSFRIISVIFVFKMEWLDFTVDKILQNKCTSCHFNTQAYFMVVFQCFSLETSFHLFKNNITVM